MNIENNYKKQIIGYTSLFSLCFSIAYSLLLIYTYITKGTAITQSLSIHFSYIIPTIFFIAYILQKKNNIEISKHIILITILCVNFYAGILYGFDLISIILAYIYCILILSLTSNTKEIIYYLITIILSIFIGTIYTQNNNLKIDDIIEYSIMFIFFTFILVKINIEKNKTLTRAIRSESIIKKERDMLEQKVIERTKDLEEMQQQKISEMYHILEFGKLSSGLYHDLMTPIQTMSIYLDKLDRDEYYAFLPTLQHMKKTHIRIKEMMQNIKKQMQLHTHKENFSIIKELQDIIDLVKNQYLKEEVNIIFEYDNNHKYQIENYKSILNHIILNLFSNAFEACLQDKKKNNKYSYNIKIFLTKHNNKYYLKIEDNGIGIEKENIDKIYDSFYSTKANEKKHNTGIGLSTSKYFLEKYMQGTIHIESEYNEGTNIVLSF